MQRESDRFLALLSQAQRCLDAGFAHLPPCDTAVLSPNAAQVLQEAATRLRDNFPYAHPLYAGQMLKPPHPVARAAYTLAMSLNPNNHALDGGRASSAMEVEAVSEIAAMFGMPQHLGHLTGGGTFANLEALWAAGRMTGGKAIAASSQAHYTHARVGGVLRLPFVSIPVDGAGRMDMDALEKALKLGEIGTVVATLGTTATGAVDPLDRMLDLQNQYAFRIHVDAAYGGYFTLVETLDPSARAAFDAVPRADSIVVDPHKHGLQPYGCGCVLFRDPLIGRLYAHDSPYTYFTSDALHLGEISLECSRPGAAAVALWTTQRLLPLVRGGEFAHGLDAGRAAALELYRRLAGTTAFIVPPQPPQLDIAVWTVAAPNTAASSALAQRVFDEAAKRDLHLALAKLPVSLFPRQTWPETEQDETVTCLRSVLMKPLHRTWIDEIWDRLVTAAACSSSDNPAKVPENY